MNRTPPRRKSILARGVDAHEAVGNLPDGTLPDRHEEAEECIDSSNVAELIRVGKVVAVPGDQEVAPVARREGKMEGIADRVARTTGSAFVS